MIDIGKIEKLMELMHRFGVDVAQAESASEKISLAKNVGHMGVFQGGNQSAQSNGGTGSSSGSALQSGSRSLDNLSANSSQASEGSVSPSATDASATAAASAKIPDGTIIKCPFVGTFYRSPSPDSPSFVDIGTRVKKGQTLCIVEAMKLMNEIESELDGVVVAILIENGKTVEYNTSLFVIAP